MMKYAAKKPRPLLHVHRIDREALNWRLNHLDGTMIRDLGRKCFCSFDFLEYAITQDAGAHKIVGLIYKTFGLNQDNMNLVKIYVKLIPVFFP